ncbi:DEAD/DEAH box helicase [Nitrincola alkalilacustris]|uniref:DEAD/DEAH box helicase n=1 Tax=Nitrincola alkalilacustris TaxID=1571224 RepID=UPI001456B954|nr:DEAD/DEAH box helicase [Nitrincola alkalilacustris]
MAVFNDQDQTMLIYNRADIALITSQAAFQRGERYYEQGRVILLTQKHDASRIRALVAGSGSRPYEVDLQQDEDGLYGLCSCPVGHDCKHVVATALTWLEEYGSHMSREAVDEALPSWEHWLASMPTSVADKEPGALEPARHYLLYELQQSATGRLEVSMQKGYLKKNGDWSQLRHYSPDLYRISYDVPEFMTPQDLSVLRLLKGSENPFYGYVLEGERGALLLQQMLLTQRLRMKSSDLWIRAGHDQPLSWCWQEINGSSRLQPTLGEGQACQVLPVTPPFYLIEQPTEQRCVMGTLLTDIPVNQVAHLASMPAIPRSDLPRAALMLRHRFRTDQLPLPETVDEVEEVNSFTPILTLISSVGGDSIRLPGILVTFDYAGYRISFQADDYSDQPENPVITLQDKTRLVRRDYEAEEGVLDALAQLDLRIFGQEESGKWIWQPISSSAADFLNRWQSLLDDALPAFQAQGWQVEIDPSYHFEVSRTTFDIRVSDGADHWFEFGLRLPLGDQLLDTRIVIGEWLAQGMPNEVVLVSETGWLRVDAGPLRPVHGLILELYQQNRLQAPVTLPPFQAVQLIEQADLDLREAPLTEELMQQLKAFNGLQPVQTPSGLRAELRHYQQQGLAWLDFLQQYGFGGILADDMGLGKTLQTLALIQRMKEQGRLTSPALVIAPTSLMGNWLHEARQFTPDLNVCLIHGPQRAEQFEQMGGSDLVITSYPLLLRDLPHYAAINLSLLVLDEAQAIKNPKTKLASAVRRLTAQRRLCLTGTPLENHLGELWALMDFALPGLLGGWADFNEQFRNPIEQAGDRDRQQLLASRVAPFILRRTKREVVAELPPKSEMVQHVELGGRQRELYEAIRVSMEKRVRDLIASKGLARSRIEFLDALLKLRQACIDPRLVKLDQAGSITQSAKLEWLEDNLPEMVEEGRQILLFSQFTQVLGLVESLLIKQGIEYAKLTGQTRKRQQMIDRFQSGEARVFLISLKAGGSGLNLTAADTVIHIDPWWNPAVEQQATDRAYRIGQDKPVFVYKLVASDTVEERIQQMQQKKQALADALFDATGSASLPSDGEQLLALLAG